MVKLRFSQQREYIKNLFKKPGKHLSADEVYEKLKGKLPHLSRGTVYRNLNQLLEVEELMAFHAPDGRLYFEPKSVPHHHFVCAKCQEIENLEKPMVSTCLGCISKNEPRQITALYTTLLGICERCLK